MKWQARVGDRTHSVEIAREAGGIIAARVDGRPYRLSVSEPQARTWSILDEQGRSVEAIVGVKQGRCRVRIGRAVFEVASAEVERTSTAGRNAGGREEVRSVMPGRVLRVLVTVGDTVQAGQGLAVLEAMKMENELASPRQGVVREIRTAPGRTVEAGETLVVLEGSAGLTNGMVKEWSSATMARPEPS